MSEQMTSSRVHVNLAGLTKADYRGNPSTLCQGCGHNSIASQIIAACYEMDVVPEEVVKFSGIGCSSKSPTYFLSRSFGFNGLHGYALPGNRALFGDHTLHGLGVSGDGDTASIGMGQFKHVLRRNLNLTYIVENNGVYGLTKGQFSWMWAAAWGWTTMAAGRPSIVRPTTACRSTPTMWSTMSAKSARPNKCPTRAL